MVKPYADAGLLNLAKVSGYRAETLTSLRNCSNFRRSHLFFLQCFEAIYQYFLDLFFKGLDAQESDKIKTQICELLDRFHKIANESDLSEFRSKISSTKPECFLHSQFSQYLSTLEKQHDCYKFWKGFLMADCFPYISLYVYRNWNLRVASLKQIVATYTAFDHSIYQELIPKHLHDLAIIPQCILTPTKRGICSSSHTIRLVWCSFGRVP